MRTSTWNKQTRTGDVFTIKKGKLTRNTNLEEIANNIDDLEKKADEAIEQIEDRKYEMELRSEGYKNIFKYGIAFYKKDCLIKIKD